MGKPELYKKWGTKDLTKWSIIEMAPITDSGLNEIVVQTRTRREAELLFRWLRFTHSSYVIVKTEDLNGQA